MKWIYRFVTIAVLIGALALPFFIDNQQGEPMLSIPSASDLIPDIGSDKPATSASNGSLTRVYKWQDEHGQWHYGDAPPTQQQTSSPQNVSTIDVNSNTNLIQGLELAEPEKNSSESKQITDKMTPPDEEFLSLERMQNVMQDAKLAAEAMEARNDALKALVGDQER